MSSSQVAAVAQLLAGGGGEGRANPGRTLRGVQRQPIGAPAGVARGAGASSNGAGGAGGEGSSGAGDGEAGAIAAGAAAPIGGPAAQGEGQGHIEGEGAGRGDGVGEGEENGEDVQVDGEDGQVEGAGSGEAPYTLRELAKHLDVEPKLLYGVTVPIGDGESVTLGELKNQYRAGKAALAEVEALRETNEERELSAMVQRQELGRALRALGPNVPAEALREVQAREQRQLQIERAALLQAIPAWSKPEQVDADGRVILQYLQRYGISPNTISMFSYMEGGHAVIKMLYDQAKGWEKAKAIQSGKPAGAKAPISGPAHKAAQPLAGIRATLERAKAPNASKADKLAGVAALIR